MGQEKSVFYVGSDVEVNSNESISESFAQVTFKPFNSESDINKYKHTNGYNIEQVAKRLNLKAKVHAYMTGDNQLENMRMSVEGEKSQIEKLIDFCKTILHLEVEGKPRFLTEKVNRELKEDTEGDVADSKIKLTIRDARNIFEDIEEDTHWYVSKYNCNFDLTDEYLIITGNRKNLEKIFKEYRLDDYNVKIQDSKIKDSFVYILFKAFDSDKNYEKYKLANDYNIKQVANKLNVKADVSVTRSGWYNQFTDISMGVKGDKNQIEKLINYCTTKLNLEIYKKQVIDNQVEDFFETMTNPKLTGDSVKDSVGSYTTEEIKENGFIEESVAVLDGEQFKAENAVFSAFKNSDGEIVENFVNITNDTIKESTLKVDTNKPLKELNWKYAIVKYDQNGKKRTVQIFKTEDEAIRGKENLKEIPGVEYSIEKIFEEAVKIKR